VAVDTIFPPLSSTENPGKVSPGFNENTSGSS